MQGLLNVETTGEGKNVVGPTKAMAGKAVIIDRGVIRQQDVTVQEYTKGGARISSTIILEIGQQFLLRMTHVAGKLFSWFSEVDVDPEEDVSFEVQAVVVSAEQTSSRIDQFRLEVKFSGNYRFISAEQATI